MKNIVIGVVILGSLLLIFQSISPSSDSESDPPTSDFTVWNCEDLTDDVISLSEKNSTDTPLRRKILKVYDPTQVSRTFERITCEGRALLESGDERSIEFYAFIDEDGDGFFGYRAN